MTKRLLFCSLVSVLAACQRETDIQPTASSLANEVVGTYHTNFYLDPANLAIPADQMPFMVLKAETGNSVTLIYTKLYPAKTSQVVEHISLFRQAEGIQLQVDNTIIGTLQTDRIFTNNGMEKQGKLLRLSNNSNGESPLDFVGSQQN